MIPIYYDAVLNESMQPLFNGTPEETKAWLETKKDLETEQFISSLRVCIGRSMAVVTVPEYMRR